MVPDWITKTAESWGHEVRKFEKKITGVQGTMGRIAEEGEGASIRQFSDHIPYIEFPREINKFHKAWNDLEYADRDLLWKTFVEFGNIKDKIKSLGLSKSVYYRRKNEVLMRIAADFHLYD